MHRPICIALAVLSGILGQAPTARPTFEDFSVKELYEGVPASPKLSASQRTFRTVIRNGARSPVQFAGHYTIPSFGCGTACSAFYIVDSISGRVYDGFSVADFPATWIEKQPGDPPLHMEFHANSRMIKINGCPNERDCGYYDYAMVEGKGLKLLKKQLLPQVYQY